MLKYNHGRFLVKFNPRIKELQSPTSTILSGQIEVVVASSLGSLLSHLSEPIIILFHVNNLIKDTEDLKSLFLSFPSLFLRNRDSFFQLSPFPISTNNVHEPIHCHVLSMQCKAFRWTTYLPPIQSSPFLLSPSSVSSVRQRHQHRTGCPMEEHVQGRGEEKDDDSKTKGETQRRY